MFRLSAGITAGHYVLSTYAPGWLAMEHVIAEQERVPNESLCTSMKPQTCRR